MPERRVRPLTSRLLLTGILLAASLATAVIADAAGAIARIERLPRSQRLPAYERALADGPSAASDRIALVQAFARHTHQLSPLYSKSVFPFDQRRWISLLREGFDPRRPDPNVALSLAQLLVDADDPSAAAPVISAFKTASPGNHAAQAWSKWLDGKRAPVGSQEPLLSFPLHFCVLTSNPAAHRVATLQQCRKECEILNDTFRTLAGAPLVRFELKGFSPFDTVKAGGSELLAYGDTATFSSDQVARAFNACADPRVRDPKAINVYIYDSRSAKAGSGDLTSHGKRNSNRPYVFLDWERLNGRIQNAEAHEMGHAFGLEHVGAPGAGATTSTNIMTSAGVGFGSGGLRDLGFTPAQSALIRYHAGRTYARLGLGRK